MHLSVEADQHLNIRVIQYAMLFLNDFYVHLPLLKKIILFPCNNGGLQKRERTGKSFLYWLDLKSKYFSTAGNFTEWKATQSSLRVFSRGCSKKSCKIPFIQNLIICGLATQSIQTAIILPFSFSKQLNTFILDKDSQI